MNPGFVVLVAFGAFLVVGGFFLALRRGPEGSNELSIAGIKIKSTSVGVTLCVLGAGMVLPGATQLMKGEPLQVTDVSVTTDATEIGARCPVTLKFVGKISATGKGKVTYRFVTTEGLSGSPTQGRLQSLVFGGDSTKRADYDVVANIPDGDISYTVQLEVVKPGRERSSPVTAVVHCQSDLPEGPPVPPPDVPGGPPG